MNHPSERAGASVPSGVRRSPRDEHEAPRPSRKLASIEVEHGVTVGHVEGLISIRMGMNRRSRPRRDAADHPRIAALGDIWPYNGKAFCKVVAEHDGCPTDGRHRPLLNVVPTERLVSPAILKRPLEAKLYRDARHEEEPAAETSDPSSFLQRERGFYVGDLLHEQQAGMHSADPRDS